MLTKKATLVILLNALTCWLLQIVLLGCRRGLVNRLLRRDIIYESILRVWFQSMLISAAKESSEESKLLAGCSFKQAGAYSGGEKLSLRPNLREIQEQRELKRAG